MARHYSPKAFMVEAPNRLLKEYYEREGLNGDIPWRHLSERDIDFVFRAYENAPEAVRRKMDNDFRSIHNLADEAGIKTLIEVGQSQFHNIDFISIFGGAEGHVERIPIPSASAPDREAISALVQKCLDAKGIGCEEWEKEIDERVAGLYGLR